MPQHVIQRGKNRQATFFTPQDQSFYLACLQQAARRHDCAIGQRGQVRRTKNKNGVGFTFEALNLPTSRGKANPTPISFTSRSYIHRACWLADHREHAWDKTLGALPKAMAAQACWKIATWTMEIHGGHGYVREFGVEKLVRDATAFLHSDGVNRTLFLKAANFMFSDVVG